MLLELLFSPPASCHFASFLFYFVLRFVFGCASSLLLSVLAFLWLRRAGAALRLRCPGRRLRARGPQQLRLPSSRAQARQLWCVGFVSPWYSWIGGRTCVS